MAGTLTLKSGDSYDIIVTIVDEDGTAVDLTSGTVRFAIKKKLGDTNANAIYYTSVTSHSDPTNGETTISITEDTTKAWTPSDTYIWQLRFISSTGTVSSTDTGICKIIENLLDDEA